MIFDVMISRRYYEINIIEFELICLQNKRKQKIASKQVILAHDESTQNNNRNKEMCVSRDTIVIFNMPLDVINVILMKANDDPNHFGFFFLLGNMAHKFMHNTIKCNT